MHAFVLPVNLTHALEDAIKTTRIVQKQPDPLDARVKNQGIVFDLVASVNTTTLKFSGAYVGALRAFHSMKNKARLWIYDIKWLEQDWRNVKVDVDLFGPETGTAELSVGDVCARHQILANEVISKFSSSSLASEFVTTSGKGWVSFDNLVGEVCEGWLNDAPIDFCMEMLSGVVGPYYALSSLTTAVGFPRAPTTPICPIKIILLPVHLHGNHWGVIIAQVHYVKATDKLSVRGYMYEPMIDVAYHEDMEAKWNDITDANNELVEEGLRGFVQRWHQASVPRTRLLMKPFKWIDGPQQHDYFSCGVVVVAHAYSFLTHNHVQIAPRP
ncbi:hypothetical protein PHYSODRAFT_488811 [Phytophthora sojae]|uniref:Uncharacterized protein n=1 Tax=Phytophthora sojae (strain P6497) TaxID=1094619 RepID=G4Z3E3_PHYSP|nr:hypothetical protein PHYSODRAFT_488811 [Phytophthora sojae]EGZ21506.1 hypothetical protein PHYSODRAFT_488811 [Phytophthora sojae]|eukprot:XP_009524223.1 hypothetical protein PHYSODRAFT_488811 [Phytophthora sojae]